MTIEVLGVPVLNRPDLLYRMLDSIDTEVGQIVIIDNGGVASQSTVNQSERVIRPGQNLGVAASWNLIMQATPLAKWWAIVNFDLIFAPGDLDRLAQHMDTTTGPEGMVATLGTFSAFGVSREAINRAGWFDENFHPAYCLVPETLVLTDDLRWVPIGSLSVGSSLIGVDEDIHLGRERRFRKSVVTAVSSRRAPCLEITLADGRTVICTEDHLWIAKFPARTMSWGWRRAGKLKVGHRLMVPLDTWVEATGFNAGWLSGILDGEGCLHHTYRMSGISISQKNGPVLRRIKRELESLGIPYTWRMRKPQGDHDPIANVEVSSRRKAMELIGRLQPERINRPELWDGRSPRSRMYPNSIPIIGIEPVGVTDVVSMETTTKTFIANGIVSHNCEDNDYAYRCLLAGVRTVSLPAGLTHDISSTIASDNHLRDQNYRTFGENSDYYRRKWGGSPLNEEYSTPFDNGGDIRDWHLDIDRLARQTWETAPVL